MIDSETAEQISKLTLAFWQEEVTKPQFVAQAVGKEIGHRIANLVEERLCSCPVDVRSKD